MIAVTLRDAALRGVPAGAGVEAITGELRYDGRVGMAMVAIIVVLVAAVVEVGLE